MRTRLNRNVPRIEELSVRNYRALKDLQLKGITPLTVFLGPNGSGKSTIFDVFAFLSECFSVGLRKAWDKRGRFKELRTRGGEGPIVFELKYREQPKSPIITYHLAIEEGGKGPFVMEEWLQWRRKQSGKPFRFLDFSEGKGRVVSGEVPDEEDRREDEQLDSPERIAVNTLGNWPKTHGSAPCADLSPAGIFPTLPLIIPEPPRRPVRKKGSPPRVITSPM